MTNDSIPIAFHCEGLAFDEWQRGLQRYLPEATLCGWPDCTTPERIRYALVWDAPPGMLAALPGLQLVLTPSAGVDHILQDPAVGDTVRIARLGDAGMAVQMIEYVLYGVLHFHRDFDLYRTRQRLRQWQPQHCGATADTITAVLGIGAIGAQVATALARYGFQVRGWSRSPQRVDGVDCYHGPAGLRALLKGCHILVNLLPLTAETRSLLDHELFAQLPRGACIINCGRGETLVEDDLIDALDRGQLRGALLDVLEREPADAGQPLWHHPGVLLTPHIAAQTRSDDSCRQIAENIRRHQTGQPLLYEVDRGRGY